jgi:hypothetical protein
VARFDQLARGMRGGGAGRLGWNAAEKGRGRDGDWAGTGLEDEAGTGGDGGPVPRRAILGFETGRRASLRQAKNELGVWIRENGGEYSWILLCHQKVNQLQFLKRRNRTVLLSCQLL